MFDVTHAHESVPNERAADAKAREPDDSTFGGFVGKVRTLSGSPIHVTEMVAEVPWRCNNEATAS